MDLETLLEVEWTVVDGNIYTKDAIDKLYGPRIGDKSYRLFRASIAYNVGKLVAEHIVELHNEHIKIKENNDIRIQTEQGHNPP